MLISQLLVESQALLRIEAALYVVALRLGKQARHLQPFSTYLVRDLAAYGKRFVKPASSFNQAPMFPEWV